MLFKKLEDITPFIAGDATLLREWLHPKNDEVELPYSLAFAEVAPGAASLPHTLQTSTEVYIVLEGEGIAHIGDQIQRIHAGELIVIPAGAKQFIENTGVPTLKFLCIVSPPWAKKDEIV